MTEEQKDNLEKMAKGKLNLLECRAVAESILSDEIFNRIQQQVSVEPVVKVNFAELKEEYEKLFESLITEEECEVNQVFIEVEGTADIKLWKWFEQKLKKASKISA